MWDVDSVVKTPVKRRKALIAGLAAGVTGPFLVKGSYAAEEKTCSCLAAPDCSAICPFGGTPKGEGTQACVCFSQPTSDVARVCLTGDYADLKNLPELKPVAYTGSYEDLIEKPKRALSDTDGGDALDADKWNGYGWSGKKNVNATKLLVIVGNTVDYVDRESVTGMPTVEPKTFSVTSKNLTFQAERNKYGQLVAVTLS